MTRRSTVLALLATITLALGLCGAPVAADPASWPFEADVDKTWAHPGDTVLLTATLANTEAVDITFSYMAAVPYTWMTNADFLITDCTGDITWCSVAPDGQTAAVHHQVVIPPGATRTTTFPFEISADTPCGRVVYMFVYGYYETAVGTFDGFAQGPTFTGIVC